MPRHATATGAGIGLRSPHAAQLLERRPPLAFLETHSENHFGRGGRGWEQLLRIRACWPLSLHGVGLSIGSADPLDRAHLDELAALVEALDPILVSEHLCWSSVGGIHANDLLPLPYTEEALDHVVARVQQVQDRLGRRLLLENVSSYVEFAHSTIPEPEFLSAVARRSGCGLLLDVNNVHVSARNHGFDPLGYLQGVPADAVAEYHLAGHVARRIELDDGSSAELLIDTHSRPVDEAVWALYACALALIGPRPTLIEWDADLPPLDTLLAEAAHAQALLDDSPRRPARPGRTQEAPHAWAA
ncbi:MAG: DUF692 domain-containing protein [Aquabacterium sp.]|jgi:uncharacterized protein (UPF0276 family)|nr:MAG: DUF692 domain-containing protein [Aquabacterium sp.]